MDGLIMKYFVLKPENANDDDYAFASRMAMRAYAANIKHENPQLAEDLDAWIDRIEQALRKELLDGCERALRFGLNPSLEKIITEIVDRAKKYE